MTEQIESAKVIALKAKNVKRLSAVEIHPPDGEPVVVVGGKNAQGKTSVLDSIMYALAGTKNIPDDVVKHGQKKAQIEVDLGELKVTRVLGKGAKLEVKAKDGRKLSSPQRLLDELAGSLTFDPLHFQRLSETTAGRRQQATIVRDLVGLDFTDHDNKRQALYDSRTDTNRELKRAETQLETMPFFPQAPAEPIKVTEVAAELQKAAQHNDEVLRLNKALGNLETTIETIKKNIEQQQAELERLIAEKMTLGSKIKSFKQVDTEKLNKQLEEAQVTNDRIAKNKQRREVNKQVSELQKQSESLTEAIEELDQEKQQKLSETELPIEGLTFSEDGVLFNNVPFHNCSSAEQLKLSVAMGIKMNPKLRIMLIRDGSLLDDESLETLRQMAAKSGHQVWLERVGIGEECMVVIDEGTLMDEATLQELRAKEKKNIS